MPKINTSGTGKILHRSGYVQISHRYGTTPEEMSMMFRATLTLEQGGASWAIADNVIWRKESECMDRQKRRLKQFREEK